MEVVIFWILGTVLVAGLILLIYGHRKAIGKCPKCEKWISDTVFVHCVHEGKGIRTHP